MPFAILHCCNTPDRLRDGQTSEQQDCERHKQPLVLVQIKHLPLWSTFTERISSGTAGRWRSTCQPRRLTAVAWSVWLGRRVITV